MEKIVSLNVRNKFEKKLRRFMRFVRFEKLGIFKMFKRFNEFKRNNSLCVFSPLSNLCETTNNVYVFQAFDMLFMENNFNLINLSNFINLFNLF